MSTMANSACADDAFLAASSSSRPGASQFTPSANTSTERDDWWYKGTDNLFLNRSGEHRMTLLSGVFVEGQPS